MEQTQGLIFHIKQTDAVDFYLQKVKDLEGKILAEQKEPSLFYAQASEFPQCYCRLSDLPERLLDVVFVTFTTMFAVRASCQPFSDPHQLAISPAPEYKDVYWDNLLVDRFSFVIRQLIIVPILVVITVLWVFPYSITVGLVRAPFGVQRWH